MDGAGLFPEQRVCVRILGAVARNQRSMVEELRPRDAWQASRPPRIGRNVKPEVLLCHCFLDGGAYEGTSTIVVQAEEPSDV